jgi:hypothetical protein
VLFEGQGSGTCRGKAAVFVVCGEQSPDSNVVWQRWFLAAGNLKGSLPRGMSWSCQRTASLAATRPAQHGTAPTWVVAPHQVGHGLEPHMVWLTHEHILLRDAGLLHPLHQRVRSVQHNVSAAATRGRGKREEMKEVPGSWAGMHGLPPRQHHMRIQRLMKQQVQPEMVALKGASWSVCPRTAPP